jgi:hypothetical protein
VLHHRHPAVVGGLVVVGLALLDVLEVDLLNLLASVYIAGPVKVK